MAAEKTPADKTKKDAPKTDKKSKGHPFLVGITMGLIFGIIFGWWVPAPGFFDKIKTNTSKQVKKGSDKAKENLADSLENTANKLRD